MKHRYAALLVVLFASLWVGASSAAILNYMATIDGLQETPPVATPASGSATITIDTVANTLTYSISYSGLIGAESAAHIHGFAPPGTPTGVLHGLPAGQPKNGVWNYAEGQEANILAGQTYINIHTSFRTGGEIRGQIVETQVPTEPTTWGKIKADHTAIP